MSSLPPNTGVSVINGDISAANHEFTDGVLEKNGADESKALGRSAISNSVMSPAIAFSNLRSSNFEQ